jgi:hypothetical protein
MAFNLFHGGPMPNNTVSVLTIGGPKQMRRRLVKRFRSLAVGFMPTEKDLKIIMPLSKGTVIRLFAEVLDLTHWQAHQGHPRLSTYQKTITA